MATTRYIEINSSFRNRNIWPKAADFEILFSENGSTTSQNALDPISLAAPKINWASNSFATPSGSSIVGTVKTSGANISQVQAGTVVVIDFTKAVNIPNFNTQAIDYFAGAVIQESPSNIRSRITKSRFLQESATVITAEFTIIVGPALTPGNTISITDPTDFSDFNNIHIFVPGIPHLTINIGDDTFRNSVLYNQTLSVSTNSPVYRNISRYDPTTHMIYCNVQDNPIDGTWKTTDKFDIRSTEYIPALGAVNNNPLTSQNNVISVPRSFNMQDNFYRNSWIRFPTTVNTTQPDIYRKIIKNVSVDSSVKAGSTIASPANGGEIIFNDNSGCNTLPGYYNNAYIEFTTGVNTGTTFLIEDYTVTNSLPTVKTAIISILTPIAALSAGDEFFIRSIYTLPFPSPIAKNDIFEILLFNRDNSQPLLFSGSVLSQQEMVCYQIELINLVLPNRSLVTGNGGLIAFYPYVYVSFQNVSAPGANLKEVIYSNNPVSRGATFRAAIDDTNNPVNSAYIKIGGGGMVQTIKFKPTDNLRFTVKLPDGELFETENSIPIGTTTGGPFNSNPINQISALFSIKRLS